VSSPAEADRARADAWYESPLGAAAHRIEVRLVAALLDETLGVLAADEGLSMASLSGKSGERASSTTA